MESLLEGLAVRFVEYFYRLINHLIHGVINDADAHFEDVKDLI